MAKTVLITGASRGIGAETARRFAKEGYNVVINYVKNKELAEKVAEDVASLGGTPLIVKADVSKDKEAKALVERTISVFGKIDVLVSNAGVAEYGLLIDSDESKIDRVIDVNLKGTINVCKYSSEQMIKQMSGRIINVSSMWGVDGGSNETIYSASKAGVIGFSKALAKELGFSNINVNVVAPGVIKTDMISNLSDEDIEELASQTILGRIGMPKDVAGVIYFLASEDASYITGQVINVRG